MRPSKLKLVETKKLYVFLSIIVCGDDICFENVEILLKKFA